MDSLPGILLIMGQINPITGSILQIGQTQPQEAAERTRQVRKTQNLRKNAAGTEEIIDIPVENTAEVDAINDGHANPQEKGKGRRGKHGKSEPEKQKPDRLDLTA
jgi:hypothetical protein